MPLPPNRWRCAPELQASAAGRELAAALATLAERSAHFIDIDANAAAPLLAEAWDAYVAAEQEPPSDDALRIRAAQLLDAAPDDIHWTAGGTEADVLGLLGVLARGDRVVTSPIEHAALGQMLGHLAQNFAIDVAPLPLARGGIVDVHALDKVITPTTKLVLCMAANNETGVVQPVGPIAERCCQVDAIFHIDAVQAFGRMPHKDFLNLPGQTMVALAGHKLGALGHTGLLRTQNVALGDALKLRSSAPLSDAAHHSARASLVAALGAADAHQHDTTQAQLRDDVERRIVAMGYGAQVIGGMHARLSNTSCIFWPGIEAEAVLMALDARNVTIGAGAACSSGSTEPSPSLLAMGMTPADARCCIRLSWQRSATAADAEALLVALGELLPLLSPA